MHIIFLIPKLDNSGPVKGSLALISLLANNYKITVIFLKDKSQVLFNKKKDIKIVSLENHNNFISKIIELRNLIKDIKGSEKEKAVLISQAFSVDFLSLFTIDLLPRITSVRGNLFLNYYFTYKFLGIFLAIIHLNIMRFSSQIIVMHKLMQKQVRFFTSKKPVIISNFINEKSLSKYFNSKIDNSKPIKFVFVGSLNHRKNPLLLLKTFSIIAKSFDSRLHFLGDGPLLEKLKSFINENKYLKNKVFFHGFQINPYSKMNDSDLLVLPSFSEGTSRAALESLFLGIPCILRNVDSNNELIKPEFNNGELFDNDDELAELMISQALKSRERIERKNLLPDNFKQENIKKKYIDLIQKTN